MALSAKMISGGVAAAVAAGVGYLLLSRGEQPASFHTVSREGAFSVRDYPRLWVAETVIEGMRESAVALGLGRLAHYIFGPTARHTVPVIADGDEDGRGWRTRLALPARIDPDMLPRPGAGVALRQLPPRRIAAMRFAGKSDDHSLFSREAELRQWMKDHDLRAAGPVEHAFYNSPLTPPRLRRSEVLIPLAA
ncbi:MAG: heme-binding protein [Sphingomonadales bacterium]|nr:MAG: heme-binding protein [Sphingomonadales bacterium]